MVISGAPTWLTLGWLVALVVLVLAIVFIVIGQLDLLKVGFLLCGLAVARLL